jgi:uncharacterized repeat protein (TIGR01451 family)
MRAVLPAGTILSLGDGTAHGTGSVFGFRPGYVYRLRTASKNADPNQGLGITIEVRGSIVPRPNMNTMEFPAPLHLSETDIDRITRGGVITKVVYLEDPSKAIAQEQKADEPLETLSNTERDALLEAEASGRIAAIVRIGDLAPSQQELAESYIPGTVLLPGEQRLGLPAVPPLYANCPVYLYDPILGPKVSELECFPNGGDGDAFAGIGQGGKLYGLDTTDVIAEYTRGSRREATSSNVVCLCSPRFVTRKVEAYASGYVGVLAPLAAKQFVVKSVFDHREQAVAYVAAERTLGLQSRIRPTAAVALEMLHALISTEQLRIFAKNDGLLQVTGVVQPEEESSFPTRLVVTKSVEPAGPYKSGDVVTITLKYSNNTRQTITDIVLADSLSPRLEYVAGSAAADRVSNISTRDNGAGSVVVTFDIPGPILPGTSGVAVFKVKIR